MKAIARIIATLVVVAIVVPVIALGVFFATFDANKFKDQVTHEVSTALGREVAIAGPVGLSFHQGVALSLKDVRIGNPAGFAEKDFAKAGTLFVSLNWQELLMRKVDVTKVTLADASLSLITAVSGQNNWDFPMGQKEKVKTTGKPEANMLDEIAAAAKENRSPDFSVNSVALNNVELTNVSVKQVDQRGGKKQEFVVDHAVLKIPASGAFHAEGKGLVNGTPLEMRLDTKKSLRDVREGTPIPMDMHLGYGGQTYDLKGDLSFKGKTYRFDSLQANAFGSSFTGTLQADLSGTVPYVSGNIASPEFDLTKMSSTRADNGKLRAIPIAASVGEPNLAVLRSFNSDLGFSTPRLVASPTMVLENIGTRIKVTGGVLRLEPVKVTYQGVTWEGDISADDDARVHVALHANNVDYTALAQSFGTKSPVNSKGDIMFDLTGRGLTAQAFMATVTGKVEITSGSGNVDWSGGNGIGGALVKTLIPAAATEKPKLTCAAIRFNAQDGVLHSNGLLLESNYATVGGEGSVNLKNQSADLLLRPVPKGTTTVTSLTGATPIRVSGALTNLSYYPQADAVLQRAVGGLLSPGQKVSTGVPRVDANAGGNPCLVALNNPQPIMLDPPDTKQVIKGIGKDIGNIIKNPTKGLGALLGGGSTAQQPAAVAPASTGSAAPAASPSSAASPTATAPTAKKPSREEKAMDAIKGLLGK